MNIIINVPLDEWGQAYLDRYSILKFQQGGVVETLDHRLKHIAKTFDIGGPTDTSIVQSFLQQCLFGSKA